MFETLVRGVGIVSPVDTPTSITDYVPGQRAVFRNFGALEGTQSETIEPDNGGTKVTHKMDGHIAIPLIGRFLDPMLRKGWEQNLSWGKREIERRTKG